MHVNVKWCRGTMMLLLLFLTAFDDFVDAPPPPPAPFAWHHVLSFISGREGQGLVGLSPGAVQEGVRKHEEACSKVSDDGEEGIGTSGSMFRILCPAVEYV